MRTMMLALFFVYPHHYRPGMNTAFKDALKGQSIEFDLRSGIRRVRDSAG